MISVIIPVYNSEKYIRKCMDSVCAQTYSDMEIIAIDDGSTDRSLSILNEYQAEDTRIHVFTQVNSGQAVARNNGIKKCHGDYITFVDSDDWLDEDMLEVLVENMASEQSDISICNIYRTYKEEERVAAVYEEEFEGSVSKGRNQGYVFNITSYPVAKLFRKELMESCHFSFPNHYYEDVSAIPLLLATAEKISFVAKAKYYYRNHAGSTVYSVDKVKDRITCMNSLVNIFREHHLYEQYKEELKTYMVKRAAINVRMMRNTLGQYSEQFIKAQNQFMRDCFSGIEIYKPLKIVTWGSYNSYTISKVLMNSDSGEILTDYYGGESIVSLFGKRNLMMNFLDIRTSNQFRFNMVRNDFTSALLHKNVSEFSGCDIVLLDFLEERFDIGVYEDNYFTLSDAFDEMSGDICYQTLDYTKKMELWKCKAGEFADLLRRYFPNAKIILLEMKLCEYYGMDGKETCFSNLDDIQKTNRMLDEFYEHFVDVCPGIIKVELFDEDYYYTYSEFRHGCHPWHLRQGTYSTIARKIEKLLDGS